MKITLRIAALAAALALAACGDGASSGSGSAKDRGVVPDSGIEPSPGTKGPGKVDSSGGGEAGDPGGSTRGRKER